MFLTVLRRVFRHTRYRVIVVGVALAVISAALLLPNRTVVEQVVFSEAIDSGDKFAFVTSIFASLGTNFTILSSSYLILVAILFGVNIALLTFYIRRRQEVSRNTKVHFASIGGMASAILGIGCA
ncbi:hypothetical protein KC730_02940, partial [Candidatus Kaiserbacteria bacterium]|nr:hypothetical protein [Candidatus Kaiserbacteria bacterium]